MVWRKRKRLGLLGKQLITAGLCLLVALSLPLTKVRAGGWTYALVYGSQDHGGENDIKLYESGENYRVAAGDTLWEIAEKCWGDGEKYRELAKCNADVISDPDLIYPDMVLQINRECYIVNDKPRCQGINLPWGWTVGYLSAGDYWSNCAVSGDDGAYIACVEQKRQEDTALTLEDWEACKRSIEAYASDRWGENVKDFSFEHYLSEAGDNVYLYSFVYLLDGAEYGREETLEIHACVGVKMTQFSQAQFIGFDYDGNITDSVRYVTAAYERNTNYSSFSDVAMGPVEEWDMKGLIEPFSWIRGFHDARLREILDIPAPEEPGSRSLLNRIHSGALRLGR